METYLSKQAIAFLWAVALGGALGGFYDFFRILRILRGKDRPVLVFLEDVLFTLGAALSTAFCFTLTNYGQVRLFLLVGEGLGFALWFYTLGAFVAKVARFTARVLAGLKRILGQIFRKFMIFLKKPFLFLQRWFIIIMCKFGERRRSHEIGQRRKGKACGKIQARGKDEPGGKRPFNRRRHLYRHHAAGAGR
jgi:spore cortex biosynthesis protein YabQ